MTCPEHPTVKLRCPACEGARGGAKNTPAQVTARTANVQRAIGKGGWPKGRPRGPRMPRAPKGMLIPSDQWFAYEAKVQAWIRAEEARGPRPPRAPKVVSYDVDTGEQVRKPLAPEEIITAFKTLAAKEIKLFVCRKCGETYNSGKIVNRGRKWWAEYRCSACGDVTEELHNPKQPT